MIRRRFSLLLVECRRNRAKLAAFFVVGIGLSALLTGCQAKATDGRPFARKPFGTTAKTIQFGPMVSIERVDAELAELRALSNNFDDPNATARLSVLMGRFLVRCEQDDFRRMLRDPSPLIRTMALTCLAFQPTAANGSLKLAMRPLSADDTRLPLQFPSLASSRGRNNVDQKQHETIADLASLVQSGLVRDRLPSLPHIPAGATAGDCIRLLRCCRSSANPAESPAQLESTQTPSRRDNASAQSNDLEADDDAAAWKSAALRLSSIADRSTAELLLSDSSPVVRAAGFVVMARSVQPDAIDQLSIALHDDAEICGATASHPSASIGDLAARLLSDPRYLLSERFVSPPLSDDSRRALLIRLLATDGPTARSNVATAAFASDIRAGANPMDAMLAFIAQRDVQTMKALGRGSFCASNGVPAEAVEAARTLLIAAVDDASLDGDTRFAAASALTLDPTSASLPALIAAATELNNLAPRLALGTRFVVESKFRETLRAREGNAAPATASTVPAEGISQSTIAGHPLLIVEARERLARVPAETLFSESPFRPNELDQIVDMLERFRSPWDAYADAGYQMETLLVCGGSSLADLLGSARLQRWIERCRTAEAIVRKRATDVGRRDAESPTTGPSSATTPP